MAREIDVDGVPHALTCLAALAEAADRELDGVLGDAADTVASRTRLAIPLGPPESGHLQSSVRVERTAGLRATVAEGGARFEYVYFLEFGGHVGRRHAVHREYVRSGRYLYPAVRTVRPGLPSAMHEGLREAARSSGWNPTG